MFFPVSLTQIICSVFPGSIQESSFYQLSLCYLFLTATGSHAGMSPTTPADDDGLDHGPKSKSKDASEKPVCYCNWDRSTCPDCKKGWLQEIQSGRAPKVGHSSKLSVFSRVFPITFLTYLLTPSKLVNYTSTPMT